MKTPLTLSQYMSHVKSTFCYIEARNEQTTWRYLNARPLRYEVSSQNLPCRPVLVINLHSLTVFPAEPHFNMHLLGRITRVCEVVGAVTKEREVFRSINAGEYVPSKFGSPLLVFFSPDNRLSYLNLTNGMYSYADDADLELRRDRLLDIQLTSAKDDLWTA